jgi:hypothetical protein
VKVCACAGWSVIAASMKNRIMANVAVNEAEILIEDVMMLTPMKRSPRFAGHTLHRSDTGI